VTLVSDVRELLTQALNVYAGTPAEQQLRAAAARLDEPLRVAIAGKVKAGKSTLLNAIVGEELAPTDASECTKIVTWYRDGLTYKAAVRTRGGQPQQVPFRKEEGAVEVDLSGVGDVESIEIEWPSAALKKMILIDTPGIGSLSTDVSERTRAFLTPDADTPTAADAVLYLMRHVHSEDVRFLEAFHDDEVAQPTPINAIGVLSRADELGAARSNAMDTALRIADRYKDDPKVRKLCQTVIPVAGLLAQSGQELREDEFKALAQVASSPRDATSQLLLSVERFIAGSPEVPLTPAEREHLLYRFGLFGVRTAVTLIRDGIATTSEKLSQQLVERSGLKQLEEVLLTQFAGRSDVLKARSAILALEAAVREFPSGESDSIVAALERIHAGAHEFAEIRLLNALRSGAVKMRDEQALDAERLLGASGMAPAVRLGLDRGADPAAIRDAATKALKQWRARAESPMASREVAEAATVLSRTCEGLIAQLSAADALVPSPGAS
jgi:predicted GTPase